MSKDTFGADGACACIMCLAALGSIVVLEVGVSARLGCVGVVGLGGGASLKFGCQVWTRRVAMASQGLATAPDRQAAVILLAIVASLLGMFCFNRFEGTQCL